MKTITINLFIAAASASSLRGQPADTIGAAPPDFHCFYGTLNGEEGKTSCGSLIAADGSHCVWCSKEEGETSGACLSNNEAILANGKFGLTCPLSIYIEPAKDEIKNGLPDINCFKAAWAADNAESACGQSQDTDGEACIWCQANDDAAGACLSRSEAGMADGQFGLSCPSGVASILKEEIESGLPDINCFKAAWVADNAESACGVSRDNDGEACIWCQANDDAMGACLSRSEAGMADGQFGLSCPDSNSLVLMQPALWQ